MSVNQPGEITEGMPVVLTNEPVLGPNAGVTIGNVGIAGGGNNQNSNATVFWNNVAVLAGAFSASVSISGYGKIRVFVRGTVANTFNVQISLDGGANWHTLTQDNAGTPLTLAITATQLASCRDLNTFGGLIRLVAIAADATGVTAGYAAEVV